MKEKDKTEKKLEKALVKKALGFDTTEVIEEYSAGEEGEIKLIKKKVTKKNVPPDLSAIKMLMESSSPIVRDMTDEELMREKQRLVDELKEKLDKKEKKGERKKQNN